MERIDNFTLVFERSTRLNDFGILTPIKKLVLIIVQAQSL